jgi:hypothetical protein
MPPDPLFFAAQTWFLPVAAFLYRDRAVEWLALALHHPKSAAGWVQRWSLVDRLRADLEQSLPSEQFSTAWIRGQTLDLRAVVDKPLERQTL